MEEQISYKAIGAVLHAETVFSKFLSANVRGETGGHQSGILVLKSAKNMMFMDD